MGLKLYRAKVFCGNILAEETPEYWVLANLEEQAEKIALGKTDPKNLVYLEFVEAIQISY